MLHLNNYVNSTLSIIVALVDALSELLSGYNSIGAGPELQL